MNCDPRALLPLLLLASLAAPPLRAQEPLPSPEPAAAPEPMAAQEEDRLTVHGFLTQAYAFADGRQTYGISEEGTADYRTAALQFRYAMSDKDTFVLQLSHERIGRSELQGIEPDVAMDWVFYQRQLPQGLTLRAGKIKMPFGLYNETRDVGTLLPFYRPSVATYLEGGFSTETINGLDVARAFPVGDWTLTADAYYGEWSFLEMSMKNDVDVRDAVGAQVWLTPPTVGVRLGAGGWTAEVSNFFTAPGGTERWKVGVLSAEARLNRVHLAAEYARANMPDGRYQGYYVTAGARLWRGGWVYVQREVASFQADVPTPYGVFPLDIDTEDNWVAGLRYVLRDDVVARLERHWAKGYAAEDPESSLLEDPVESPYTILSLSVSF